MEPVHPTTRSLSTSRSFSSLPQNGSPPLSLDPSPPRRAGADLDLPSRSVAPPQDQLLNDSSPPIASSSRPIPHRARSSSSTSFATSQTTIDPSTAPTSPRLSPPMRGVWRPTRNVPPHIQSRHQMRRVSPIGRDEDRNRWLSEDEGLDDVARSIGRRRRRALRRGSDEEESPDREGGSRSNPRPPSSTASSEKTESEGANRGKRALRPTPRRTMSSEAPAAGPSSISVFDPHSIAAEPPRIEDIVAAPSTTTPVGSGFASGAPEILYQRALPGVSPTGRIGALGGSPGAVPDFAKGHGGDGIGGVNMPVNASGYGEEGPERVRKQKELLGKLMVILGCALCPSVHGVQPPLHRPITLPCGHTLSADHVAIPAPAPLVLTSELPHDIFAAQQRQHQQRLSLWAGVMCPIPTCKRFSPQASTSSVTTAMPATDIPSSPRSSSSGTQRSETLASGVTYDPPLLPVPPVYTPDLAATGTGSPLLDVSVDKVRHLVMDEMAKPDDVKAMREAVGSSDDDESDDEDAIPARLSHLGKPDLSPTSNRMSKRRRSNLHLESALSRASTASPYSWPFQRDLMAILECDVCSMLMYEPVTTPCQHSFCSKCLSRSLDHSSRCPVCRQDLPSFAFFQDHAVNKVLVSIIQTAFPNEYIDRQMAIERDERDARLDTPIFVCTLAFPGMPTTLLVFEPRYRLMIRRCVESSNPRFGMVLPARGSGPPHLQGVMEHGTMLEILSVQMLPDGRSMVETVGTHRFRLVERGNLDGYTVGKIERIDDISPEDEVNLELEAVSRAESVRVTRPAEQPPQIPSQGPQIPGVNIPLAQPTPAEEEAQTTEEYMNICRAFIDQLRSGSAPWLLQRLNHTYGTMPTDACEFSYWMALVMPIDEYEKARLLPIRSPRLRLKLIVHWIESLRSSWWFSSGVGIGRLLSVFRGA